MTTEDELLPLVLEQERDHALILLAPDGRVVAWRAAAPSMFGYAPDEIVGTPFDRLFVPEDRARGEPPHELEVAIASGRAEDDRWSQRKDGSRFWASGMTTALTGPDGTLLGFCKIVRDRTDIKAQLDTYSHRAEGLSSEFEQRDRFVATLAHELRNPLAALSSAVELIARTHPDPSRIGMPLDLIARQVDYIRQLTDDLFDLARMARGRVRLVRSECLLRAILQQAIDSCLALLTESGQHVDLLTPSGDIVLSADPVRLQQVFVNLIANASKYSPRGARIFVAATVEGEHAVVRVEDRGQGIPHALIPHVFELFTRGVALDAGAPAGLGIGLALVKNIVELHHGTVHARSEGAGRGTEIVVRLPLRDGEPAAVRPSRSEP